jgi:hypothetical protein
LHSLLGLGPLGEAQERLRITRKRLADDAKAVGGVVSRVVEGVRHVDGHRVVALGRRNKPAPFQEPQEVGDERRVVEPHTHGLLLYRHLVERG